HQTMKDVSRRLCVYAITAARGSWRQAARLLGIPRSTFHRIARSTGLRTRRKARKNHCMPTGTNSKEEQLNELSSMEISEILEICQVLAFTSASMRASQRAGLHIFAHGLQMG